MHIFLCITFLSKPADGQLLDDRLYFFSRGIEGDQRFPKYFLKFVKGDAKVALKAW